MNTITAVLLAQAQNRERERIRKQRELDTRCPTCKTTLTFGKALDNDLGRVSDGKCKNTTKSSGRLRVVLKCSGCGYSRTT